MVIAPRLMLAGDPDPLPDALAVLAWHWDEPVEALSSASVGGGRRRIEWALNIGVAQDYGRIDLDAHVAEVAAVAGAVGAGTGLLTAAGVPAFSTVEGDGVRVDATVGVTKPTWAADPDDDAWNAWSPGTINIVLQVPVPLDEGAAVNAVITATEAKTQALLERGVPGTGTASDAVVVVWPSPTAEGPDPERFAGPRSPWGARIARAVHAAVEAGLS